MTTTREQTINIDCEPCTPRPNTYLTKVLEGTGIEPVDPYSTFFGNWAFDFSHVPPQVWDKANPIIASRLKELYNNGTIRYASW